VKGKRLSDKKWNLMYLLNRNGLVTREEREGRERERERDFIEMGM
jgi:hypothetical protein